MTLARAPRSQPILPGAAVLAAGERAPAAAPRERVVAVATLVRAAFADAAPRTAYARTTYAVGVLLLLSGVVHAGVWAVLGGAWDGAVSWRKPILFGVSFGLFSLSAGWVQGTLPPDRRWGWATTGLVAVGAVGEVGLITAQQWRGTASHFNVLEPVDTAVWVLMGITIAVFGAGVVLLAAWAVLRLRGPAPTTIAVVVGMALVLTGSAVGGDLMTRGMAYVEAHDAVPSVVVIGAAGSGKLAHAVALHGIQVLGVLALLLGRSSLPRRQRTGTMVTAAAGYVAVTGLVAAQAYAGRSMLDLGAPTVGALALAALTVVAAFGWALRDALRGDGHDRPTRPWAGARRR